jgi:hypothetical protein
MTGRHGPTPAEVARQRAEQQRREIEAAHGEPGGRDPLQAAGEAPADVWAGRTCSEHSGRPVDRRSGRCPLCSLNPITRLRHEAFEENF